MPEILFLLPALEADRKFGATRLTYFLLLDKQLFVLEFPGVREIRAPSPLSSSQHGRERETKRERFLFFLSPLSCPGGKHAWNVHLFSKGIRVQRASAPPRRFHELLLPLIQSKSPESIYKRRRANRGMPCPTPTTCWESSSLRAVSICPKVVGK